MYRYVLKRLGMMVLVMLGISIVIYCLMELSPLDRVVPYLGENYEQEDYDRLYLELNLDKPVLWRYTHYMADLLRGDLGYSPLFKDRVWTLYKQKFPTTISLTISATLVATIISLPLAVLAALNRGNAIDNTCSVLSVVGMAAPNFWVGLMLMLVFALKLGWFNAIGFHSWKDLVLPAITLGTSHTASVTRHTRSAMIDVLEKDYLQLARAKGLSEKKVVLKHALGNALIPFIQVTGQQFSGSLGGSVITESVFTLNGVGRMMNQALKATDATAVMGCMMIQSFINGMMLLILDLLYALLDPRIKARYSK